MNPLLSSSLITQFAYAIYFFLGLTDIFCKFSKGTAGNIWIWEFIKGEKEMNVLLGTDWDTEATESWKRWKGFYPPFLTSHKAEQIESSVQILFIF